MNLVIKQSSNVSFLTINTRDVYARYYQGGFASYNMPLFKNIIITNIDVDKQFSQSPEDDVFCIRNRSGTGTVMATDNCDKNIKKRLCNHCRQEIPEDGEVFKIIYDIQPDPTGDGTRKPLGGRQFHSRNCAYKFALDTKDQRIIFYTYAYYNTNPEKPLKEAKPWELLDINGGPLSVNEWEDPKFEYAAHPSVIVNVKHIYERTNSS